MKKATKTAVITDLNSWDKVEFEDIQPLERDAEIVFLESIIEDQAYQIEALQLRIQELTKKQCGC